MQYSVVTRVLFFVSALLAVSSAVAHAKEDPLVLYIDADYTIGPKTAQTIELGLRAAFLETWAEEGIQIVARDHRNNARRSFDNINAAWADPRAIAIVGGKQSPPYIIHGEAINDGQMPLLLPWSAGGILTRMAQGAENWIFRVSVDDFKAAKALVKAAVNSDCARPALAVVDNPWGNGNARRLTEEFVAMGVPKPTVISLPVDAGNETVVRAVAEVMKHESDCVILVSVFRLGAELINAFGTVSKPPQVISHWGILGVRLTDHVSFDTIRALDLQILGTCGLQRAHLEPALIERVDEIARETLGRNFRAAEHPAPHGFFNAHDLGKLLLAAIDNARSTSEWSQGTQARRRAIRDALHELDGEIEGLLKVYRRPFSPTSEQSPDGHEALGASDLCMTEIDPSGNLIASR